MKFIKRYKFSIFLIICALGLPALVCMLESFKFYPVALIVIGGIMVIVVLQGTAPIIGAGSFNTESRRSDLTYDQSVENVDPHNQVRQVIGEDNNQENGNVEPDLSLPSLTSQIRVSGFIVIGFGILAAIVVYGIL